MLLTAQDASAGALVRRAIDALAAKSAIPAETLMVAPPGGRVVFVVMPPVYDAAILLRTVLEAIQQRGLHVTVDAMGDEAYEVCRNTATQMRGIVQQSDDQGDSTT